MLYNISLGAQVRRMRINIIIKKISCSGETNFLTSDCVAVRAVEDLKINYHHILSIVGRLIKKILPSAVSLDILTSAWPGGLLLKGCPDCNFLLRFEL